MMLHREINNICVNDVVNYVEGSKMMGNK